MGLVFCFYSGCCFVRLFELDMVCNVATDVTIVDYGSVAELAIQHS